MAQKSTSPQPPKDPYAQRTKQLTSAAQRLRGWVSSDASREPELADALVELNAHRLLGHAYAAAAADAQDAARRATQLLTANGPIGPYTVVADGTRYVAAVVHFAQIQIALGAPEAAGRTLDALDPLRSQLPALDEQIDPRTALWALIGQARALLAADDISSANAYADAALDRLAESGLAADPDAVYLVVDVERLAAEGRWRAGRTGEALAHLHAARDRFDRFLDGRLAQPARLSPALLERLAEPLPGVYGDLADRLPAVGEVELGLVTRRDLVEQLRAVAARLPEPSTDRLIQAMSDLAFDLRSAGRDAEADIVVTEIAAVGRVPVERTRTPSGPAVSWTPLDRTAAYAVTTAGGAVGVPAEPALERERERETAAWLETQRAEAHRLEERRLDQARREAAQAEADRAAAEQAAAVHRAADDARAAEEGRLQAERQAAGEAAEQAERKRRREERLVEYQAEQERAEAERAAARQDAEATERATLERNALERAQQAFHQARTSGDRRSVRTAGDRLVEVLRPQVETDLATYGPMLQATLEDLTSARLRGGDVFGSRAAAKEAKEIGRRLAALG